MAAEYQTFASLAYVDGKNSGYDGFMLDVKHYFAPQITSGVMDEFGYLDTDSKIYGGLNNFGSDELVSVGGEYFYNENIFVRGAYSRYGDFDSNSVGMGYLLNSNLKMAITRYDSDGVDEVYQASAEYVHQLAGYDYLGFSVSTDTDFDAQTLSARYFTALNDQQHLAIDAAVHHNDYDDVFTIHANYYFNPAMSLGAGLADSEWMVNAKYFIDTNIALFASYVDDQEQFTLGISGQY